MTYIRIADDPNGVVARGVIREMNAELQEYWELLRNGASKGVPRLEAARSLAARRGLACIPAAELAAKTTLEELVSRIETFVLEKQVDIALEDAAAFATSPPRAGSPVRGGLFCAYFPPVRCGRAKP